MAWVRYLVLLLSNRVNLNVLLYFPVLGFSTSEIEGMRPHRGIVRCNEVLSTGLGTQ